jgi:hypothetical protein
MRKTLLAIITSAVASPLFAAAFTPGNAVVYRVGDGTGTLTNVGHAIFLDEYLISQAGTATLVQSIPLPTADSGTNKACIASGTANSEGLMTRSADGQYLVLTCYGRALGGVGALNTTTADVVPRVIARIAADGTVDTSTALSDYASGNNPRSAVSVDGTRFWAVGGTGGVRTATFGATTSTEVSAATAAGALTNLRQINIAGGNLIVSNASGTNVRLQQIGTGLPTTSGNLMTALPGILATGSPYGFFFADLDAAVAGDDTLYVADDTANTGGVQKYSLVAGSWVTNGTITSLLPVGSFGLPRGITGGLVAGTGIGFATVAVATGSTQTSIVAGIDTSAYNAVPVPQTANVATAPTNTAFRGIARAPEALAPTWNGFANGFE